MSDSEDDYMSDKLLLGCEKQDIRPGLLFNSTQKRKHEIYKHEQEMRLKKPKSYHEQEKETREKGLNTALPTNNIGFKLLEKMGFKSGSGLGKTVKGITEPISIQLKTDCSGVGRANKVKGAIRDKTSDEQVLLHKQKEFLNTNAERRIAMTLYKDYSKAQRICEELDFKANVKEPKYSFFWTRLTRESLKKKNEVDEEEKSSEDSSEESDEEVESVTEETLSQIITYIRTEYKYCIFCGDFVESDGDCPGYFRADHDD